MRMTNGDRTISIGSVPTEQYAHWSPYYIASSHHHSMLSLCFNFVMFQEQHDAVGGCRNKTMMTKHHATYITWMESIHILIRIDGIDHFFCRNRGRKRQLY